jgi:hypothetical protein
MAKEKSFKAQFTENSKNEEKLKKLIKKTELEEICETIGNCAGESLGLQMWTSVLSLIDDENKLLKIVEDVNEIESLGNSLS